MSTASLIKAIAPFVSVHGLNESGQPWTMTIRKDGLGESYVFTVTVQGSDDSGTPIWFNGSLTTSVDLSDTQSQ